MPPAGGGPDGGGPDGGVGGVGNGDMAQPSMPNEGHDMTPPSDSGGGGPSPFASVCTPTIQFENDSAQGDGKLFDQNHPDPKTFLQSAALKVCEILYHQPSEVPKVPSIKFVVEDMDGVAYTAGHEVHLSSQYLKDYRGDLKTEISGVVHHEFTHVYQYNDGPGWLIEGMADFVRYRSGLIPPSNRGRGGHYDDAYQTTAFFLVWLDDAHQDFGYQMNQSLTDKDNKEWSTDVFKALAGKDVDTLWSDYQDAI
jgi:hypothetical protein